MLFVNFGDKERAEAFLAKRIAQKMDGVVIKSFDASKSVVDEIRAMAVPEHMAKQFPGRPLIVDTTKTPDSYGLTKDQIQKLMDAVVQGTGEVSH